MGNVLGLFGASNIASLVERSGDCREDFKMSPISKAKNTMTKALE